MVLLCGGLLVGLTQPVDAGPGACVDPSQCYGLTCGTCGTHGCYEYGGCAPSPPYKRTDEWCNNYYYGCYFLTFYCVTC
ncbi:MAG: hypothetical protein AB1505_13715 [Candidatus Latescibacterota bacterium]